MSNAEAAEDKGWKPKVLTGGKEPPTSVGDNWLSLLDKGTIFLYRKRTEHPGHKLDVFQVIHQWGDAALLGRHYEDQPDYIEYVDTKLFSNLHQWFKTIMVLPKSEETGESNADNDKRDRSDQ